MKTFFHLLGTIFLAIAVQAQTGYTITSRFPGGVAAISQTVSGNFRKVETRFGLLDEKSKQIILPVVYRSVYPAGVKEIFIVKDSSDNQGLFSIKKGFVIKPVYKEIRQFTEGYAVVVAKGKDASNTMFGAIDVNGKVIIPLEYEYLGPSTERVFNFRSRGKFGFINAKNEVVIAAKLAKPSNFGNGLTPALDDKTRRWGFINKKNEFVIPPQFQDADDFYDGYAAVYKATGHSDTDLTVGLIDVRGKLIIPMEYEKISLKKDGVFIATLDKKQALFDSTGKLLMPADEQIFTGFSGNGLGSFKKNNKWGLVTNRGKILLPAAYDYIYGMPDYTILTRNDKFFSVIDVNRKTIIPGDTLENFLANSKKYFVAIGKDEVKVYSRTGELIKRVKQANLKSNNTKLNAGEDSLIISHGKSIFFFDITTGKKTLTPYEEVGDFKEGIATVQKSKNFFFVDKDGNALNKTGYASILNFSEGIGGIQENANSTPYLVDRSFNKVAPLTTRFYGPYSEGLAKTVGPRANNINYLDRNGNIVFTLVALEGLAFREGRAAIRDSSNKWYFVDKKGKTITKELYQSAAFFSEGLAAVQKENKWGYIDTAGELVIPFDYDGVSPFQENVAMVKKGNDLFLVSKKGEPINNDRFTSANDPENGSFPVKKGDKFGLIDNKGNVIVPFNYENMFPMSEGVVWAMKNKKWGLVNSAGKEISSFIYDNVGSFKNGYAIVDINKKEGLVDKSGKVVLPLEYDQLSSVYDNHVILVLKEGSYSVALSK